MKGPSAARSTASRPPTGSCDHHQDGAWPARPVGTFHASGGSRPQYLPINSTVGTTPTTPNGTPSVPWSSRRRLRPEPGRRFSPLDDPVHRPLKAGPSPAVRRQRLGRQRAATYYVSVDYEGDDGVYGSGFEQDSVTPPIRARSRDNQLRPNTLDGSTCAPTRSANVSRRTPICRPTIGYTSSDAWSRTTTASRPVTGSGEASWKPGGLQPRLVPHPRRALRRTGTPGGRAVHRWAHRATGGRELALHPGHAGL